LTIIYLPTSQKTLFVSGVKEKSTMKFCTYKKSVILAAPIRSVFAFHENPENLRRISPPSLRVKTIVAAPTAVCGELFEITATQYGLPIRWTGRWETVEAPTLLVDIALAGPFPYFRHAHHFEALTSTTTQMTDHVDYRLPFGWLGWLAGATGGWIALALMFRARHRATRAYFEKPLEQ